MKRIMFASVAALVLACSGAGIMAADALIKGEIKSAYVWRGVTINDGPVFQPSLNVEKDGAAINVWANTDLSEYGGRFKKNEISEVDIEPSCVLTHSNVTVTVGLREYLYPHQSRSEESVQANGLAETNVVPRAGSSEVFGIFRCKARCGFYGGMEVAYDFDTYKDSYWRMSLGYEGSVKEGDVTYILDASAGVVGRGMVDDRHDGLHEYTISAKAAYSLSKDLAIGAWLAYTDTLNKDTLAEQDVNFYGGASIGYKF